MKMDKMYTFMFSMMVIGMVLYISIMVWDLSTRETRITEECKQDCNDLNLDYFKVKSGAWNQNSCICINQEGEPFMIWQDEKNEIWK